MKYKKRDCQIKGWFQLDGHEEIKDGDIGVCSMEGEITSFSDEALLCYNWVKWLRGTLHYHNFDSPDEDQPADTIGPAYLKHLFYEPGSLEKDLDPERTYSIWRKKPTLQRRSWQDEPLPLP